MTEESNADVGVNEMPKADLQKRIIAGVIDAVAAMVVGFIPWIGGLVATAYWLTRDGLDIEFMNRRSIGKQVMKLRPVTADGQRTDMETSIKRNWPLAVGGVAQILLFIPIIGWILIPIVAFAALILAIVELVLVVTDPKGRRMGDKFGGTQVIESEE